MNAARGLSHHIVVYLLCFCLIYKHSFLSVLTHKFLFRFLKLFNNDYTFWPHWAILRLCEYFHLNSKAIIQFEVKKYKTG
jgi:hypothetical protein